MRQLRKRSSDTTADWSLCLLGQKESSKDPTQKLGTKCLDRVQQAMVERKRYQDYERWDIIERLEAVNLSDVTQETEMVYHKVLCYIHKFIAPGQTEEKL